MRYDIGTTDGILVCGCVACSETRAIELDTQLVKGICVVPLPQSGQIDTDWLEEEICLRGNAVNCAHGLRIFSVPSGGKRHD